MTIPKLKNIAYIDGANLHKGIQSCGWGLDYGKFRIWLKEKYQVEKAYLFMGLIPGNVRLYEKLQDQGYELIFKQIARDGSGKVKGNCDADLVLKVVSDFYEDHFEKAVLITGDGDFACLVEFLIEKGKLKCLVAPNAKKCSYLIRKIQAPLVFLNQLEHILSQKEKAPETDETETGSSSW